MLDDNHLVLIGKVVRTEMAETLDSVVGPRFERAKREYGGCSNKA